MIRADTLSMPRRRGRKTKGEQRHSYVVTIGNDIIMNNLIMDITKDIMKDFIVYIKVANFYVSPGPLLLNFTITVDVNNMKDQDCLLSEGPTVPA